MEDDFQDDDVAIPAKRFKLNCVIPPVHERGLLDLSDDVLLIIFAYLSPTDLINLSQSCMRLWNVTRDRTLWTHVDCRDHYLDCEVFEETYMDYLLPCTRFLAVDFRVKSRRKKGRRLRPFSTQSVLTSSLIRKINQTCCILDTLILQDVTFSAQQIPVRYFPGTLTYLSLKNSDVRNLPARVSYFNEIHLVMPNLQVLILSHSLWLESHSLMAISKCLKLHELRLQGCFALGDCIAYFSIATRFGFKALETLDLRGTQVGDPEVSCLNLVPTLRHLYLESIGQYARRRDAEYYMNRVRQFPDITIVPHPNSGPVQSPVILLQRIDGEMVARNVTSEFHGIARADDRGRTCPHGVPDDPDAREEPGTSRASPPNEWGMRRFRADPGEPSTSHGTPVVAPSRFFSLFEAGLRGPNDPPGNTSSRGPVVVVPMPQRGTAGHGGEGAGTSDSNGSNGRSLANLLENEPRTYHFSALERALRIRGVLTVINDKPSSSCVRNPGSENVGAVSDAVYCDKRDVREPLAEGAAKESSSGEVQQPSPEERSESPGASGSGVANGPLESGQSSSMLPLRDGREREPSKPSQVEEAVSSSVVAEETNGAKRPLQTNGGGKSAMAESDVTGEGESDGDAQEKSHSGSNQSTGSNIEATIRENVKKQKHFNETKGSGNRDAVGLTTAESLVSDGDRCSSRLESTSAIASSDTSDCGREGGDEGEEQSSSGIDCRRFKRPPVHDPGSRTRSTAYESDEDSDVGTDSVNYREYMSRYGEDANLRPNAWNVMKNRIGESNKGVANKGCLPTTYSANAIGQQSAEERRANAFTIENGPGCSYVTRKPPPNIAAPIILDCSSSLPSCSRYESQHYKVYSGTSESSYGGGPRCSRTDTKKYKLPIVRREQRTRPTRSRKRLCSTTSGLHDEGNDSSDGEGNSDTSPGDVESSGGVHSAHVSEESESDSPVAASDSDEDRDLYFCTMSQARFPGLSPFMHRVPQITNSCVHAICSGKSYVRPQLGYNIMTLRLNPKDPTHECRLETLVLRHFNKITDQSLYVLSKVTSLRFLDVTGTSVTACGVKNFRLMRPDVKVTSDHDNPVEP